MSSGNSVKGFAALTIDGGVEGGCMREYVGSGTAPASTPGGSVVAEDFLLGCSWKTAWRLPRSSQWVSK